MRRRVTVHDVIALLDEIAFGHRNMLALRHHVFHWLQTVIGRHDADATLVLGHLNDNPNAHLEIAFDAELAHMIYAGSDIIVVPSNYEPCGLTQMIGLKYGTVPVVRGVGGLVNTVFDYDHDPNKPEEERNGFVFYQADYGALESALGRAIDLYYERPEEFKKLAAQGMEYDNSWNLPGGEYVKIYENIRHK